MDLVEVQVGVATAVDRLIIDLLSHLPAKLFFTSHDIRLVLVVRIANHIHDLAELVVDLFLIRQGGSIALMARLLVHHIEVRTSRAAISLVGIVQSVEQLLRYLLDLLVLLRRRHQSVVLLGQQRSLPLDDLPDLVLLFPAETDFALVEQSAQELAALDLLTELPLADVEQFITLLTDDGVVLLVVSLDLLF